VRGETLEKREGLTTHVQIEKDGEEEGGEGKMRLEIELGRGRRSRRRKWERDRNERVAKGSFSPGESTSRAFESIGSLYGHGGKLRC